MSPKQGPFLKNPRAPLFGNVYLITSEKLSVDWSNMAISILGSRSRPLFVFQEIWTLVLSLCDISDFKIIGQKYKNLCRLIFNLARSEVLEIIFFLH